MWGHSPVLAHVVLIWVVLLVVREEIVQLYALLEVLDSLEASDVLEELKVTVDVDASPNESVPVDALQLHIGVVLLELEVNRLTKVNVWPLDRVHVLSRHLKLVEIEVLGEHLHICYLYVFTILNKLIIK